ncbi:putative WD40/YVTN repeat-like-containing domain, WD40 repeat-like-containing domain protein, partial [Trachipleistophora hominis]
VKERRCLHKDISFVTHHKNILLIGCTDGEIHLFYKNLQHHINLAGHKSEITALSILNNYVFSCSAQNFIVYKNNSVVHNHKTNELKGMRVIDDRIYLMYNHCIRVLKHDACFSTSYNEKEYDAYFGDNTAYYGSESFSHVYDISSNATECIAKINDDLVIGGEYLMVMVKGREHRTAVQHVNLLVVSNTIVVFATLDGQIGIGDYREEQFSMCDGGVGLVYDMVLCGNVVYVAGENGTNEILLEDCGAPQL